MGPEIKGTHGKYTYTKWRSITGAALSQAAECEYKTLAMYVWARTQGVPVEDARWMTTLTFMLSLSRNSELVNTLALQRYISVSQFGFAHNIPDLLREKMPERCSSRLCSFVMKRMFDKAVSEASIERLHDTDGLDDLTEKDIEYKFSAECVFFGFTTQNVQVYLAETYLSHLCSDMLRNSQHNYNRFVKTMKEYESKEDDYFEFDEEAVRMTARAFREAYEKDLVKIPVYEDEPITVLTRSRGVLSGFSKRSGKLYDEVVRKCRNEGKVPTVSEVASDYDGKMRFCLLEKRQKQEAREIFKTELSCLCKLRIVETQAHEYCRWSGIEYITKSGDQKYFTFQSCVHKVSKSAAPYKVYRTSDSSKWSTGDNPDIMKIIASEMFSEPCTKFFESIRNRHLVPGNRYTVRALLKNELPENWVLHNGWPQGFFNKMSSLKHVLMCTYALALYNQSSDDSHKGSIEMGCHSDDFYYAASFPNEEESLLWERCLQTARRKFCIRENTKKSSASNEFCEFLSIFSVNGSIIAPQFKHITSIMKDRPGGGYTADLHSITSRVRECMRFNVPDYWISWALDYVSNEVMVDYSMSGGRGKPMMNWMPDEYEWPEHMGGRFHCTPITLLFMGNKGNLYRIYRKTKWGPNRLSILLPGNYPLQESEGEDDIEDTDYNLLFLYPKANVGIPTDLNRIKDMIGYLDYAKPMKYELICREVLTPQRQYEVAHWYIWSGAASRMYSRVESGLMRYYITSSAHRRCIRWGSEKLTLKETYTKLRQLATSRFCNPDFQADGIMSALVGYSTALSAFDDMHWEPILVRGHGVERSPISVLCKIDLFQPGLGGVKITPMDLVKYCEFIRSDRHFEPLSSEKKTVVESLLKNVLKKDVIDSESDLEFLVRLSNSRLKGHKYMFLKHTRFIKGYRSLSYFIEKFLCYSGCYVRNMEVPSLALKDMLSVADTFKSGRFVVSGKSENDFLLSCYNAVCCGAMSVELLKRVNYETKPISEVVKDCSKRLMSSRTYMSRLSRVMMWYRIWGFERETEEYYRKWSFRNQWVVFENRVSNPKCDISAVKCPDGLFRLTRSNCFSRGILSEIMYLIQCALSDSMASPVDYMMLGPRLIDENNGTHYVSRNGMLVETEARDGIDGFAVGTREDISKDKWGHCVGVRESISYKWNSSEQRAERRSHLGTEILYPKLEPCGPAVGARVDYDDHMEDLLASGMYSFDTTSFVDGKAVLSMKGLGKSSSVSKVRRIGNSKDKPFFEALAGEMLEGAIPLERVVRHIDISESKGKSWWEIDQEAEKEEKLEADGGPSTVYTFGGGSFISTITFDEPEVLHEISSRDKRIEYMNLSPSVKISMHRLMDCRKDYTEHSWLEAQRIVIHMRDKENWGPNVRRNFNFHMMVQVALKAHYGHCKDTKDPSFIPPTKHDFMMEHMENGQLLSRKGWMFIYDNYGWDRVELEDESSFVF
eukprot:PLAT253.1.p1 GENE.PLAT253.1~~PLAT253.1.p1  ORF type:complete len:1704 (+),score=-529.18 PLAT253.1:740-5113(+)